MEKDTAGAPESPEGSTIGVGEAVIDSLPGRIEVFASRQRQSASRLGVNIHRIHCFPRSRPISSWPLNRNCSTEPASYY
jgi:hypothetical protein